MNESIILGISQINNEKVIFRRDTDSALGF